MRTTQLPKGFYAFIASNGKEKIQYKETIKGIRRTHSCKIDPRKDPIASYEEITKWKASILNPSANASIVVPPFAKNHISLDMTLEKALNAYLLHFANIDHNYGSRNRRIIRPSEETIRVAKGTAKMIGRFPLGKIKLYKLDEDMIQTFFYDLADKYTFTKQGVEYHYSKTTATKAYALIKNFIYEMGWERVLFQNVRKAVHNSEIDTLHLRAEREEDQSLTDEETKRFLEALYITYKSGNQKLSSEVADAIFVMYDTALRPAEVRGLQKRDYDALEKSLYVRRSIPKGMRDKPKETKTKTQEKVYLSDKASWLVEKHLRDCLSEEDYIFKAFDGSMASEKQHRPLTYHSLYSGVKHTARDAGITNKSVFPYLARHTQITQTFNRSKNIEMAQQVARHKRATTTLTYYIHSNNELAKEARLLKNNFY